MKKLEVTLATHRLQEVEQVLSTCPIDSMTVTTMQCAAAQPASSSECPFAPRFKIDILTDDEHCLEVVGLLQRLGPPVESADLLVTDVLSLVPIRSAELDAAGVF